MKQLIKSINSHFSGLEISGDIVIGGMPHESHPPYLFEGLIKDLAVWNKPLSAEQVWNDILIADWNSVMYLGNFGEGSQFSTNQKRESTVSSLLIG